MELEIKGFIEFCRFLSQNPDKIINNPQLFKVLEFCHQSISSCSCAGKTPSSQFEEKYYEQIKSLDESTLLSIGEIFDVRKDLSAVYLTFPINDIKIKIK
jgi:hypothetical protein